MWWMAALMALAPGGPGIVETPIVQVVRLRLPDTWEQTRAATRRVFAGWDTNRDGTIDRAEQRVAGPLPFGLPRGAVPTLFETADTDRDGRVRLSEAEAYARGRFARIDTNRDGRLSPAERAAARMRVRIQERPDTRKM